MIPTRVFWLSALFAPVLLAACEGIDPITKCRVTAVSAGWNEYIEDVDVDEPDSCPFLIDVGRTKLQSFYGVVTARHLGGVGGGDYIVTEVVNSPWGVDVGTIDDYSSFHGVPAKAEGSVTYTAGTGSGTTSTTGKDVAVITLHGWAGQYFAEAGVDLTIKYDVYASISAPTYVTGGTWITVSATASNHRTPLRYKWWRNGTLMSVTAASFSTNGPTTGTSTTYKVEITDADGDKGTDPHTVTASSSMGGGGGGSGGCLVQKQPVGTNRDRGDALPCPDEP